MSSSPKRIEQNLHDWEAGAVSYINELTTLHQTIEKLMDMTFHETYQECRAMLALVEKRARECRDRILRMTGTGN